MNNQTLLHSHLTQHYPMSEASGSRPAWSCSFVQLARGVCTISAARRSEQRDIGSTFRAACTSPPKGMHGRPGHQIHTTCSFSRDGHGLYSSMISQQLEQPFANPTWLLVLLKQGQF